LAERSVFITATATDTNGCLATDTVWVLVRRIQRVYVPNIFSPESAGNETWWVFAGPEVVLVERMAVFDRWGNKVFERLDAAPNDLTMGWNGTYQDQTVENGVYVYVLRLRLFNGDVLEMGGDLTVLK
jgi:gliding motility-associated-like protein